MRKSGRSKRSEAKAEAVRDQIKSIETVSNDLFAEWESELAQYSSEELRRSSRTKLEETRRRYEQMLQAMRRPEQKMNEVLVAFQDHVLFLKHNLNAAAIGSLEGDALEIGSQVADLIADMEKSIAEADSFIGELGT